MSENARSPNDTGSGLERLRETLRGILETDRFETIIIGLITVNAITLGLETSPTVMASAGRLLGALDTVILTIFVLEIAARMFVHRGAFWRDAWSIFDFSVVAIALVPATGNLSVLRALRIIRALRLISTVESMRRVVSGLLNAIPGMSSISILLLLILYVSSVMATQMFGERFPELFGSVGASAFSLFTVMTLEGWPDVARQVMAVYPWAWTFFVPYILVTAFAVLNLFIGIIVDAMQSQAQAVIESEQAATDEVLTTLRDEIRQLRQAIADGPAGGKGSG